MFGPSLFLLVAFLAISEARAEYVAVPQEVSRILATSRLLHDDFDEQVPGDYLVRVFSYYDYDTSSQRCAYEICENQRLIVLIMERGEDLIVKAFFADYALDWSNVIIRARLPQDGGVHITLQADALFLDDKREARIFEIQAQF